MGNPHDKHLRMAWSACRVGMRQVAQPEAREKVLAWIDGMIPQFRGPYLELWRRVVAGDEPDLVREIEGHRDYFELSEERRGFWRSLVQSHPFTCVIPGRTTSERRALLSRMP
jgi:hypothetical protein